MDYHGYQEAHFPTHKRMTGISITIATLILLHLSSGYIFADSLDTDVLKGSPQKVQQDLQNGADVNKKDRWGITPLMAAAGSNPDPEVIITLLRAGANVNARDNHGWTPLMAAAGINENPKVIITLLRAGADVKAQDTYGNTVLMCAAKNPALRNTPVYQQLAAAAQGTAGRAPTRQQTETGQTIETEPSADFLKLVQTVNTEGGGGSHPSWS